MADVKKGEYVYDYDYQYDNSNAASQPSTDYTSNSAPVPEISVEDSIPAQDEEWSDTRTGRERGRTEVKHPIPKIYGTFKQLGLRRSSFMNLCAGAEGSQA